jgi:dTDP-4-amino-4,6-dideoxygalactose transaminase
MNNISAAIGLSQMRHVEKIIQTHRLNAALYDEIFKTSRVQPIYRPVRSQSSNWENSIYQLCKTCCGFFHRFDKVG